MVSNIAYIWFTTQSLSEFQSFKFFSAMTRRRESHSCHIERNTLQVILIDKFTFLIVHRTGRLTFSSSSKRSTVFHALLYSPRSNVHPTPILSPRAYNIQHKR